MQQHRTARVGLTAIACALILRAFSLGLPGKLLALLQRPEITAFLIYLETGRDVRFSPSLGSFSPDFMESPMAASPEPKEAPIPSFSDIQAVKLYYASKERPDLEALLMQPLQWDLRGEEPTVLILHTHATESYTKNGESYEETSSWRTLDENYNMLSVGLRLQQVLKEGGITAIQDRQLYDYPSYNGSYVAAREGIQAILTEYPTIQLVVDLHRDAAERSYGQLRTSAMAGDQEAAQLMLVLGTNHAHYEENLSLALKLHAQLESQHPGITRPLQLRPSRFNQDLSPGAVLVEVGAAGDTHDEALAAAEALGNAIITLARGTQ